MVDIKLEQEKDKPTEKDKKRYDYSKYIRKPLELGVAPESEYQLDKYMCSLKACDKFKKKNECPAYCKWDDTTCVGKDTPLREKICKTKSLCTWKSGECKINQDHNDLQDYLNTADSFSDQFARNGAAFFHYGDMLVNGPSKASKAGCGDLSVCTFQRYKLPRIENETPINYNTSFKGLQPLGNKYFTKFYKCKDKSGGEHDRHVYIDNITGGLNGLTGNGVKAAPGEKDGEKVYTSVKNRGLFPSLVENVYKINPMEFLNMVTQESDQPCSPYCIREIYQDKDNGGTVDKYKYVHMTDFDVKNIAPNDFKKEKKEKWIKDLNPNETQQGLCEDFTTLTSKKLNYIENPKENFDTLNAEIENSLDITTILYLLTLGTLGLYLLHRLLKKKI